MQTNQKREVANDSHENQPRPDSLLRLPHVLARVPIGRSTLWGWVREGRFPKPIKLGPMTSCWIASEVDAWVAEARSKSP